LKTSKSLISKGVIKVPLLFIFFLSYLVAYGQEATLKVESFSISEHQLAVKIMVASSVQDAFILGSQNIRLFYNSDNLSFMPDRIENHLDSRVYSLPVISEHEDFSTSMSVNNMNYTSVGFLNFNVSLLDETIGGTSINNNWKHIYTIHFNKTSDFNPSDITLALPSLTQDLATAFVEIAQWIDPKTSKPMNLTLNQPQTAYSTFDQVHISIGPNPTSDYVFILSPETIVNATIYTSNGQKVMNKSCDSKELILDMTSLSEGLYYIELEDDHGVVQIKEISRV